MKYKVGDKVRIKSLDWYNENKNDFGLIFCNNICFDEKMIEFCGKTVTIVAQRDNKYYYIKEDNCLSFWSEDMIEGLADEPQEKMVSLEKVEEWLYKNFYESYNLNDYGTYDLDKPYIASLFDTINEMFDDLRKTMEE
jgi:hypothetical protein